MAKPLENSLAGAGTSLAVGSLLIVIGLLTHPEEGTTTAETMQVVADETGAWRASHWIIGAGMLISTVAFLMVLTGNSRLTARKMPAVAWAVLAVTSLGLLPVMVIEATVAPDAAVAGNTDQFTMWTSLVNGLINLLPFLFLAGVVVAWNEYTTRSPLTPKWASVLGMIGGLVGIVAFVGVQWMGNTTLAPVFLVQLLQPLWFVWLGAAMTMPKMLTTSLATAT